MLSLVPVVLSLVPVAEEDGMSFRSFAPLLAGVASTAAHVLAAVASQVPAVVSAAPMPATAAVAIEANGLVAVVVFANGKIPVFPMKESTFAVAAPIQVGPDTAIIIRVAVSTTVTSLAHVPVGLNKHRVVIRVSESAVFRKFFLVGGFSRGGDGSYRGRGRGGRGGGGYVKSGGARNSPAVGGSSGGFTGFGGAYTGSYGDKDEDKVAASASGFGGGSQKKDAFLREVKHDDLDNTFGLVSTRK
jgi:hypothetical protein